MRGHAFAVVVLFVLAGALSADNGKSVPGSLGEPVRLKAAGELIDVQTGHAAPFVCDWNGDGLPDLLVGQFGGGKLLIFENSGTRKEPRFGKPELFMAGGEAGTVPSG